VRHLLLTAGLLVVLASAVAAAEGGGIFDCRAIEDEQARLACYDALVGRLRPAPATAAAPAPAEATEPAPAATAAQAPVAVSSVVSETKADAPPPPQAAATPTVEEQKQTLRERLFGSKEESQEVLGEILGESAESLSEQTDEVAAVSRNAYKKLIIRLANGQVWTQIDSLSLSLKPGDRVIIRSAMIGSFQLEKAGGSRRVRVRRTS
jgi:molybdopterin converting factor small subunit